jgi:hypothetical protein
VLGVPESWAGIINPPWITLSDTIGHLEESWHPVKVMVAALAVLGVSMQPDTRRLTPASSPRGEGEPKRARTPGGRAARNACESVEASSETDFPENLAKFTSGLGTAATHRDQVSAKLLAFLES